MGIDLPADCLSDTIHILNRSNSANGRRRRPAVDGPRRLAAQPQAPEAESGDCGEAEVMDIYLRAPQKNRAVFGLPVHLDGNSFSETIMHMSQAAHKDLVLPCAIETGAVAQIAGLWTTTLSTNSNPVSIESNTKKAVSNLPA